MAKGKRKRSNDAKLRVIAGGATPPKAVVTKRPPVSGTPVASARPKGGPPNLRREVAERAQHEAANDATDSVEAEERGSAVAAVPRKSPFPRAAIFIGLVIALGAAAYALTRNSMEPKPAPPTPPTPVEWTASSQIAVPLASMSALPIGTNSAAPSASESVPEPVVSSAPAPAVSSAPAPAVTSAVVAPKPIAPPPPPPPPPAPKPPPKPAEDNPYQ